MRDDWTMLHTFSSSAASSFGAILGSVVLLHPKQQNIDQTSVSKVLLELRLQTLGQTLCSKSEQNLAS